VPANHRIAGDCTLSSRTTLCSTVRVKLLAVASLAVLTSVLSITRFWEWRRNAFIANDKERRKSSMTDVALRALKMEDQKMRDQMSVVKNAGPKDAGPNVRDGKCKI